MNEWKYVDIVDRKENIIIGRIITKLTKNGVKEE